MNWYIKSFLLVIMTGVILYELLRSEPIKELQVAYKTVVVLAVFISLAPINSWIIYDQYLKDNPVIAKPIPPREQLPTAKDIAKEIGGLFRWPTSKPKPVEPGLNVKPEFKIDLFGLPPYKGNTRQVYKFFIQNINKNSALVSNFKIEVFFKNPAIATKEWTISNIGGVSHGRFRFYGERKLGETPVYEDRPLDKNFTLTIHEVMEDGQKVNSNLVTLNCEKWPQDTNFSATILTDLSKKLVYSAGSVGTYVGSYNYEVKGKIFTEKIYGPIEADKESPPMPPVTMQLPSTGNLKQRAIALSDEIMADQFLQFLMRTEPHPIEGKEVVNNGMSPLGEWVGRVSRYFKFRYYDRILEIKNESAQLHYHNPELDDFLKYQQMREEASKQLPATWGSQRDANILPVQIEQIPKQLRALAEQIK